MNSQHRCASSRSAASSHLQLFKFQIKHGCEILGSHSSEYEDDNLLGYGAM
jgi:hypothetical protein